MNGELRCADCGLVDVCDEPKLSGVQHVRAAERSLCGNCIQRLNERVHELNRGIVGDSEVKAQPPALDVGDLFDGAPMDPMAVAAEPLPCLPGHPFMHEGMAALIAGPTGGGRSSLAQACLYDGARAGLRGLYLGSEITEPEFNARAADLAARRGDLVDDGLREQLARVRYLNLASTIAYAWEQPETWVREVSERFDVVVIDPLSAVASALDLDFDKSNADYVAFHNRLVQPLTAAAVLLDNVGHAIEAKSRAKGASAKQDLADLTFACKLKAQPTGLILTAGKIRSVRVAHRRGDSWIFDRDTQRITRHDGDAAATGEPAFRPTIYMERVSRAIEAEPGLTRRALRGVVSGKHEPKLIALELLVAEGYVEQRQEGQYPTHWSTRAYRESEDTGPRGPRVVPDRSPGTTEATGPPVPFTKDRGPGTATHHSNGAVPLATDEQEALIARLETV